MGKTLDSSYKSFYNFSCYNSLYKDKADDFLSYPASVEINIK